MPTWSSGRVALAGDAAHATSPPAGPGLQRLPGRRLRAGR
ncbi:FAD-dependent monooxygenase [Streptomyces sp. NPDC042638]